jgi:aryl-alcohol dehydrogenase-like predicted oxidoreductase
LRYIQLGDRRASALGLGLWQFGSSQWGWNEESGDAEAGRIVERALDLGINFFDTAELYANGRSESILGRALGERRDEAIIATKVSPHHLHFQGVMAAADRSLARLGVGKIDLYQVHWPNRFIPIQRTMLAMKDLLSEGKVGMVGVSNFSLARWRAAESALGTQVVSNQVRFNLIAQEPREELSSFAALGNRVIIAYSPLAQGVIGGKYDIAHPPGDFRARDPLFSQSSFERVSRLLGALKAIGRAHEATPAQIALAWLLRQPNVIAIPGVRSVEQVEMNAAAADIALTDEEGESVRALGLGARGRPRILDLRRLAGRVLGA